MRKLIASGLVAVTALSAIPAIGLAQAVADRDDTRGSVAAVPPAAVPPADQWLSMSEIITRLEAQGYQVVEIERERNAYEVEAIDGNGFRMEAYVDPVTGEPMRDHDDD